MRKKEIEEKLSQLDKGLDSIREISNYAWNKVSQENTIGDKLVLYENQYKKDNGRDNLYGVTLSSALFRLWDEIRGIHEDIEKLSEDMYGCTVCRDRGDINYCKQCGRKYKDGKRVPRPKGGA